MKQNQWNGLKTIEKVPMKSVLITLTRGDKINIHKQLNILRFIYSIRVLFLSQSKIHRYYVLLIIPQLHLNFNRSK